MSKPIELGIERGLIALDTAQKYILYTTPGKRPRHSDPDEKARANAYLY